MTEFSFRSGQIKDAAALESIRVRAIESSLNYTKEQQKIWKASIPDWKRIIHHTTVCELEGKICGLVSLDDQVLYLLYVDPVYQGKGIGNMLVSQIETDGLRCDANLQCEQLLIKRGWQFESNNYKEISGQKFLNKWYIYKK